MFQCHPSCFSVWSFRFHMLPIPPLVCLVNWPLARVWPQPWVIWTLNFHSVYAWALSPETSAATFQLIFHFFNVAKHYKVLSVGWKSASTNLGKLKELCSLLWWGTRPHALLLPQPWCGVCHVRLEVWGHHITIRITMHWLTHKQSYSVVSGAFQVRRASVSKGVEKIIALQHEIVKLPGDWAGLPRCGCH